MRRTLRNWRVWIPVSLLAVAGAGIVYRMTREHFLEQRSDYGSPMNLRQIGQGILLYSKDHNGQYPDSLATLWAAEPIGAEDFVSPYSNDTPPVRPDDLLIKGHWSYIYLGTGLNMNAVADETVVAYEPSAINHDEGSNVLFGDGHIQFVTPAELHQLVSKRVIAAAVH